MAKEKNHNIKLKKFLIEPWMSMGTIINPSTTLNKMFIQYVGLDKNSNTCKQYIMERMNRGLKIIAKYNYYNTNRYLES